MFPECAYRIYIINASMTFRLIWSIVSSFVNEVSASRISVLGNDFLNELTKEIPIEQIPPKFGGKGKWPIKIGYVADIDNSVIDSYSPFNQTIPSMNKMRLINDNSRVEKTNEIMSTMVNFKNVEKKEDNPE